MEKLLKKLVARGRKPRGKTAYDLDVEFGYTIAKPQRAKNVSFATVAHERGYSDYKCYSLRELVSKESGLWQFCVENNLIDYSGVRAYGIGFCPLEIQGTREMQNYDNIHRLLWDCASLDEDKLEEFLLNNIKVDKKSEFEELVDRNIDVAKRLASK